MNQDAPRAASRIPRRLLYLTIVDEMSGDKKQIALDESTKDLSDEQISRFVRTLRGECPRVENVIPFPG